MNILLFDVRADPVNVVPWGPLILLLVIVFVLAIALTALIVYLLIRFKRRKVNQADAAAALQTDGAGSA
jgi:heme/copper-type cytochrome/quinol oxidase subunit 2